MLKKLVAALTAVVHRLLARGRRGGGVTSVTDARDWPPEAKEVRRRRAGDLAACTRLLRAVYAGGHLAFERPSSARAWLEDPDILDAWVADRHGDLLGHVAISRVGGDAASALRWKEVTGRPPHELAEVSRFFVRPTARRSGIEGALLGVALAEARGRGLHPVLQVIGADADDLRLCDQLGGRLQAMYPSGGRADHREVFLFVWPAAGRQLTAGDRVG